jgi:hypothetical protein
LLWPNVIEEAPGAQLLRADLNKENPMARKFGLIALAVTSVALVVYVVGCNNQATEPPRAADQPKETKGADSPKDGEHGHKPGAHGGIIVEIGRDNYHAEAVFEKGGILRLYTLGKDEARVQEVESQTLTAYVKPEGGTESGSFVLKPEPQPGDAEGKTSQFVGKLPKELWGQKLEVTIPSIRIAGERFRLGFASASGGHESEMPQGVSAAEERELYLTPGGIYTEADIKANGNTTASQKFKGVMSSHDMRPKPGDKVCPITQTKANPKFTWVVAGKTYEFCCPPCVDEFVKTAKESPEEIKEPDAYVKKQ